MFLVLSPTHRGRCLITDLPLLEGPHSSAPRSTIAAHRKVSLSLLNGATRLFLGCPPPPALCLCLGDPRLFNRRSLSQLVARRAPGGQDLCTFTVRPGVDTGSHSMPRKRR